jgi:hypothetical protein
MSPMCRYTSGLGRARRDGRDCKPVETDGAERPIAPVLEERRGGTPPVMSAATSAPR